MSREPDRPGTGEDALRRADRLARLREDCGLELPAFDGPLVVFDPAARRTEGDPIYLGGDLHAAHPRASVSLGPRPHDATVDNATVTFGGGGHRWPEAVAVEGIWGVSLDGALTRLAPLFMVWDELGRLRTWLLLPPADEMIDEGHLWLPSVPPPSEAIGPDPLGPERVR